MSRLALPYDRFSSCRAPPWSRPKTSQVLQKPNGVESEPGSGVTSDVTSDFSDVTSDVTEFGSGALKNIEQGTLGAVVGGLGRTLGSVLLPCVVFSLRLSSLTNPPKPSHWA